MVVPIQLPGAWSRLITRYKIEPAERGRKGLSELVVPITDFDELLRAAKLKTVTADISAGVATLFTVPSGKRWRLTLISKASVSTNSIGVLINDGTTSVRVTAIGTAALVTYTQGMIMEQSWILRAEQGNALDSAIVFEIHYIEEDAF